MTMEDSFSPLLHRLDQAVRWRAIHPTEPIPPIPEVLQKQSKPPEDLQTGSERRLKRLIAAADVKKGTYTI
jgi:ATP-dependent DNA helicase 2 subunit 2